MNLVIKTIKISHLSLSQWTMTQGDKFDEDEGLQLECNQTKHTISSEVALSVNVSGE